MRAVVSLAMKPCLSNASARKSKGCSLRPVFRSKIGCSKFLRPELSNFTGFVLTAMVRSRVSYAPLDALDAALDEPLASPSTPRGDAPDEPRALTAHLDAPGLVDAPADSSASQAELSSSQFDATEFLLSLETGEYDISHRLDS